MVVGRENGQILVAQVGYARVRTLYEDLALQRDALTAAGRTKVFEDRASGARADRPGLRKAVDYARAGDVLIVWKLDRLGCSLAHLIETVAALEKRGVGFRSITEAIDHYTRRSPRLPPIRANCSGSSNTTQSRQDCALRGVTRVSGRDQAKITPDNVQFYAK